MIKFKLKNNNEYIFPNNKKIIYSANKYNKEILFHKNFINKPNNNYLKN